MIFAGLCKGANSDKSATFFTASSSTTTESSKSSPPCTTRCPTASISSKLSTI